jgi:hypothetical protein
MATTEQKPPVSAQGSATPAIRIEGLCKTFGAVRALDGLNLMVERGSIFGFLGPNGAGKTTAMRILTGLARATAGRAWVNGVEVTRNRRQVAPYIGFLPQDPAFYPWMTGREFLDYVGRVFGMSEGERKARTAELLELVDLKKAARRRVGGYSGGMKQRLGLRDRGRPWVGYGTGSLGEEPGCPGVGGLRVDERPRCAHPGQRSGPGQAGAGGLGAGGGAGADPLRDGPALAGGRLSATGG